MPGNLANLKAFAAGTLVAMQGLLHNDTQAKRGGRNFKGHLEANRPQHDGRESYLGPYGESRGEAGHHRQDDAEAPDGLSSADRARDSMRDASRASRLRLDETSRASQARDDERDFSG
jgi:hypothetical protein